MTRKDINSAWQSAVYKYAFDTKNPTGAGLPASLTAPKPAAPLASPLKPSPSVRPPQPLAPKPTGLASASIGAAPAGNNSTRLMPPPPHAGPPAPLPMQTPTTPLTNVPAPSLMPSSSPAAPAASTSPPLTTATSGVAPLATTPPTPTSAATTPASSPAQSPPETQQTNTSATPAAAAEQQTAPAEHAQTGQQPAPATGSASPEQKQQANKDLMTRLNDPNLPDADKKQAAQQHVQQMIDSNPEMKQGMADLHAGKDTPQAKAFQAEVDKAGNAYVREEFARLRQQNPGATPQQQGGMLQGIMQSYQNMPEPMKWMMGIGIGGGLLGILGSMFGGGGGMGMLGLLGLGAAGLAGAAGGMFGQGAQDMMGGALGSIGQATGMIPKDVNLDKLKGTDAVQKLTQESSGGGWGGALKAWWDPKGEAAKVKGQLAQTDQLQRLMSVPEGMRAGLLKQISPNSSPAEIQQILANAKGVHGALNDPKSQLAQNVAKGREFSADPEKYVRGKSWNLLGGSLADNVDPDRRGMLTDMALYSNPFSGTVAGVADMGRNLYEGDWWGVGRGALNTASSFIPGGSLLKGLGRAGLQTVAGMTKETHDQRALTLVRRWAKEADDKDIKDWMRKFRARGKGGRWVNTRRSAKTEKRVMCHS